MALMVAAIGLTARPASSIDFYEIQIYTAETETPAHLNLELHSNSLTTATGAEAHQSIRPYEIHETLEATYGLTPHIEIGQYLATAKLGNGNYEYTGARTKVHFGIAATDDWPVRLGGNLELDYMRRQAEENPLSLELRPILESDFKGITVVVNLACDKPFEGPHSNLNFAPSGEITYALTRWVRPAVEYYGDMGQITKMPAVQSQQHFIVPALNLELHPRLELNLGVGFGLTRASNGTFVKSIVGWNF